ncbi:MAG: isoprenylcysteine carboxylmethyltransferase family protein [Elusimicrobia bacterium]|nr:isoprenylcysteine carboxylmethyltransferase family protein [Elusimicrobiota bacterium]
MRNKLADHAASGLLFVIIPCFLYWLLKPFPHDAFTLLGVILIVPSYIAIAVARIQLGASFSVSAKEHQLVTTGLYSKIRHPVYVSGLFLGIGLALCLHDRLHDPHVLVFFVFAIARIAWLFLGIRGEELALEEKFGDEYRDYRMRTWF